MPLQTRNIKKGKQKSKKAAQKHVTKKRRGKRPRDSSGNDDETPNEDTESSEEEPRPRKSAKWRRVPQNSDNESDDGYDGIPEKEVEEVDVGGDDSSEEQRVCFFFKVLKEILTIRRMASSTIINGGLISRKIW